MDQIKEMAFDIANLIDDKKGEDIIMLDLQKLSVIADYFIIATGNSERQVVAIADHIEDELSKRGIEPVGKEGKNSGRWVVIDYLDTVVHIFHKEERNYYNLERIWNDAKKIKLNIDTFWLNHYNEGYKGSRSLPFWYLFLGVKFDTATF